MHCVFDGSFDGLLSLAVETWHERAKLQAVTPETGADSLLPVVRCMTDPGKALRMHRFMAERMAGDFPEMVRMAFLSCRPERYRAIVRTLHLAGQWRQEALNLLDDDVLTFLKCHREVQREAHRFQGLLRFREMPDGTMLATFRPKHDVLTLLLPHFIDRYPDARLIVFDEGRRLVALAGQGRVEFLTADSLSPLLTADEQAMQGLWRTFYEHLSIRERENPKLRQQHMPRYAWKHLVEMQRE